MSDTEDTENSEEFVGWTGTPGMDHLSDRVEWATAVKEQEVSDDSSQSGD